MEAANIATIVVAAIAALSAWASQRAAARASTSNTNISSRVEMEKEAYDRARAYDTETINRQDTEIAELRTEHAELKAQHAECANEMKRIKDSHEEELGLLRQRIARLEQGLHSNLEELLRERLNESDGEDSADTAV